MGYPCIIFITLYKVYKDISPNLYTFASDFRTNRFCYPGLFRILPFPQNGISVLAHRSLTRLIQLFIQVIIYDQFNESEGGGSKAAGSAKSGALRGCEET